jgi:6-carboxyhexanoate--CoA ligase
MSQTDLYSIRMRASIGKQHVSGAERIVSSEKMDPLVRSLIKRARDKRSAPEQIEITIESLESITINTLTALDVVTLNTADRSEGHLAACRILLSLEISEQAARAAIDHLTYGAGPSRLNMRGAMIIDSRTGERLETDHERGVRASRFDWTDEALDSITRKLEVIGLTHMRTREALALATKVAHAPGVLAELCWSDDPDYTAGYVASRRTGYVRFPMLKAQGDPRGGRAFFVDRKTLNMQELVHYLQTVPMLINETGTCGHAMAPELYFNN